MSINRVDGRTISTGDMKQRAVTFHAARNGPVDGKNRIQRVSSDLSAQVVNLCIGGYALPYGAASMSKIRMCWIS